MADTKHTPGPWRTDEYGNIVCYPEGLSVGVLSRQLPEGELKANHLLIVAAPDLLDALTDCVCRFTEAFPAAETYPPIIKAKAAIAKATPSQP